MWGFAWGLMFVGPLCMVLIGLALYFVIVSSSRNSNHGHYGHAGHYYASEGRSYTSQGRSFEVLNERFVKGEITREQYLQMRKTMEEN